MSDTNQLNSNTVVAIDVGGTNTDLVMNVAGKEYCHKLPSTNSDPSIATIQGVLELCDKAGIEPMQVDRILHGTTVATNAVIEHEFGKIGMLTTEGFRDVLAIGRHKKQYNFSIHQEVLQEKYPLVERRYIKTVSERMLALGVVGKPLNEEQVIAAADELVAEGVDAIAICFLFSFLNPAHEERARDIIKERHPNLLVATSSGVAPVFREWYRFSTAVISTALMKVFSSYVSSLEDRMVDTRIGAEMLLVQSSGGMSTTDEAQEKPVNFLYSGPAGGALQAKFVGDTLGEGNIVGCDIGGTTADIVVISNARIPERDPRDSSVGGYPVSVPMLDIETIGTGGGSIAWVDEAGGFNVGPISAGSEPGPACYGRGGQNPTVTDAQLVLGRLRPESFLGGSFKIDPNLSKSVIKEKLCDVLDDSEFSDVYKAAMSIVELANHKMAQAINDQTIRRGHDPRKFALFPFGGAGAVHGCDLAEIIGMEKIIVPRWPGIGSAQGFMTTDIKYSHAQTVNMLLDDVEDNAIDEIINRHKAAGTQQLTRSNVAQENMRFPTSLDCMYHGQGYELRIDFDGTHENWKEVVTEAFVKKHEEEYGHSKEGALKIVNIRLEAIGVIDKSKRFELEDGETDASHAITLVDKVYFSTSNGLELCEVNRYDYEELKANNVINGPAVIDEMDTTTIVKPGWQASVSKNGYLVLTKV